MTIDEEIEQEREKSKEQRYYANFEKNGLMYQSCVKCAEYHEQLADWLEELKNYRDKNKMVVRIDCANSEQFKDIAVKLAKEQYNKAIDDCKELTFREVVYYDSLNDRTEFRELAEQLKVGGMNNNFKTSD